ncbi:MAG: copper resistance protein CopC [bacterium]
MRARALPLWRALVVTVASLALVLVTPVLGWAHASLVSSDPAAKSLLHTAPSRIRLVFSEELEPSLGRISLVGSDGVVMKLVAAGDPHDVNALVAPVHPLTAGAYRVDWRVVSADGHPVEGSYVFTVELPGTVASPAPRESVAPPPPDIHAPDDAGTVNWGPSVAGAPLVPSLLRGLAVGTLMAAAGLLVFLSFGRVPTDLAARRPEAFARWLSVAAVPLLVAHHAAWALNALPEHSLGPDMLSAMLTSNVGRAELWRSGLALLAAWAIVLARRPRLAMAFSIAAVLFSGTTGHSAAIHPMWTTPAKALHLLAGAVWLGGLLWLLTFDRSDATRFEREASRVSSAALIAVLVVTASGVVQTFLFLATPLDLFRSAYGAVALAKIAGLLVLVGFGAYHRFRVLPALAGDARRSTQFASTLRKELVVMAVVILLGGLLGYVPPPADAPLSPAHAAIR